MVIIFEKRDTGMEAFALDEGVGRGRLGIFLSVMGILGNE